MKKSNILLIVFLILIPGMVLFYYKLMAITFVNSDGEPAPASFALNGRNEVRSDQLKPFKYLVVDGILKVRDKSTGKLRDDGYPYPVSVLIEGGDFGLHVNGYYDRYVKYRQVNDTLYVSLTSDFIVSGYPVVDWAVRITAPAIKAMNLVSGKYSVFNFGGADTMSMRVTKSDVKLGAFMMAGLNLDLLDNSTLALPGGTDGPSLTVFNMGSACELTVPEGYGNRLKPGELDSTARIVATGQAVNMVEAIQQLERQ
jgi:hypothetical protein